MVRSVRRFVPLLSLVVVASSGIAEAETFRDCQNTMDARLKAARVEYDRESYACQAHSCRPAIDAKWDAVRKQINADRFACLECVRSKEPPPYANWKPGDPSPIARDGRRYIMSCSGKPLGLYNPGGALEMELGTRPGNCIPVDGWAPSGPSRPSQSEEGHPCSLPDGRGGYRSGWMRGGRCQ